MSGGLLSLYHALKGRRDIARVLKAFGRVTLQRASDDQVKRFWQIGVDIVNSRDRLLQALERGIKRCASVKWLGAAEQFKEHDA
jgi:hypothetical protein